MIGLPPAIASRLAESWPAIVLGLAVLALWEALCRGLALPQNLFPAPSYIIWSLTVRADLLMAHAWLTFYQTVLGFALSVLIGIGLGWAISKSKIVFEALYPMIVVLQVMPKEALAPLLVLWFGAGMLSRMVLAFLIAFFPMVINTALGVRSLNPNMRSYATSLVVQQMAILQQGRVSVGVDRDICRHEDLRDAFGNRHCCRRDRRRPGRARLSVAVCVKPARHGLRARDPAGAGLLGRHFVRRHRLAGVRGSCSGGAVR